MKVSDERGNGINTDETCIGLRQSSAWTQNNWEQMDSQVQAKTEWIDKGMSNGKEQYLAGGYSL